MLTLIILVALSGVVLIITETKRLVMKRRGHGATENLLCANCKQSLLMQEMDNQKNVGIVNTY